MSSDTETPPTSEQPTEQPTPKPKTIVDGFEDSAWRSKWKEKSKKNVKERDGVYRMRKNGRIVNKLDLDENRDHTLHFSCLPMNSNTFVWVKAKKHKKRRIHLLQRGTFTEFDIKLGRTERVKIWFGTKGKDFDHKVYSHFKDVTVTAEQT
jgi:hypothetical protein